MSKVQNYTFSIENSIPAFSYIHTLAQGCVKCQNLNFTDFKFETFKVQNWY